MFLKMEHIALCHREAQKGINLKSKNPKNFAHRCENIIKMIRVTVWVLVFAKTQTLEDLKSMILNHDFKSNFA
jgi:hypothetical protein